METLEGIIVFLPLRVEGEWFGAGKQMGEVLPRLSHVDGLSIVDVGQ
jgi:hypothetical protein